MKPEKHGNNWKAYYDAESGRFFARIMYISREGLEEYRYEITQDIYGRLGTFADDVENERLIRTGEIIYSHENTMYGTLGSERTIWNEEANDAMKAHL
jgi:flagellar biosynthesis regulator FlbT